MTVLLAAPSAVTGRPVDAWPGVRMTWEGWNGTVVDLTGDDSGASLGGGVRGLSMPQSQRYASDSPSVAGSRHRGSRATDREVFWPLAVYNGLGSQEWIDWDAAFWRTMHPDKPGVWTVEQPSGQARSLRLRFIGDGNHSVGIDPSLMGWERYGIELLAEQPFWQGAPIIRSWKAEDPLPFFGGPGIITISSGSTLANATIDNPGDEAAWPVWTITGPCTSVSVGVAGRVVEVPFTLAAGEVLTIDTNPAAQTALMADGLERTAELGAADFAAVPPGESVALSTAMAGTGAVSVSVTPLYRRAW